MRNYPRIFPLLGMCLILGVMWLWAEEPKASPSTPFEVTPEIKAKFPVKAHHEKLSLGCVHCHEGQGSDPESFKAIGDQGCLSCHKSKNFMADRLKFMDRLHTNPHNSIHDGPTLYCDECHNEHKESTNMCISCHANDVPLWTRKTP